MKRVIASFLTALVVFCAMSVCASADYVTVTAAGTAQAPNIDGYKDPIYEKSTAYALSADQVSGEMYIAYDEKYLYVYAEIKDATPAETGNKYANVTGAYRTDSVFFGYNLENENGNNAQYNDEKNKADGSGPADKNDFLGVIAIMRGVKDANASKQGGHAFLNKFKSASVSYADYYTAELRLEWGVDVNGDPFDTDAIFADGISIMFGVHDSAEGSSVNEENGEFYLANARTENMRGEITPYTAVNGWDKLEFGEEYDIAPATAPQTTPAQVTTAPKVTVAVTTASTTPAQTTPAQTTPAQTTPAQTTPAQTTPAQTTLAETTPAETTPAQTTAADGSDNATASESNGTAIVVSAPTVIVIMAITQIVLVLINAYLAFALIKSKKG